MTAYYNENDPKAAAWLRELIRCGHIAPGDVDERSIADVTPLDVAGYTQCHFFAGIGGWSYALRLAHWPDSRSVWTGSCPCQPFSDAGKGGGFADERHLWPAWHHLIDERRPAIIFGEQVASKDGLNWFDLVHSDLEISGYAIGVADLCAAGVGAPHIRQRLYFVADSAESRRQSRRRLAESSDGRDAARIELGRFRNAGGVHLGDTDAQRQLQHAQRQLQHAQLDGESLAGPEASCGANVGRSNVAGGLADASSSGHSTRSVHQRGERDGRGRQAGRPTIDSSNRLVDHAESDGRIERRPESSERSAVGASVMGDSDDAGSQGRGERRDGADQRSAWTAELVSCRDGKRRPIEPGTFPLAHGIPHRVGLLRGYGNAIVAPLAAEFIQAYDEIE